MIRREFDIAEGDAYNRALIDRAERRLKNLGFFKTVKITNEPGSAPDRVVINVDLEEQSTGEFSVTGGYSTADGCIGEVSVAERNLLGTGRVAKASVSMGSARAASNCRSSSLIFSISASRSGIDLFAKQTTSPVHYLSYADDRRRLKLGVPLTEDISPQLRYSLFSQEITLPQFLNNCNNINPDFVNTFPTPAAFASGDFIAAWLAAGLSVADQLLPGRRSLARGAQGTRGRTGDRVGGGLHARLQHARQQPGADQGMLVEFKQDLAGVGGDVHNLKSTIDARIYNEILPDIVGVLRGQAGYAVGWDGSHAHAGRIPGRSDAGARLPAGRLRSARHQPDHLRLWRHTGRTRRLALLGGVARIPDAACRCCRRISA